MSIFSSNSHVRPSPKLLSKTSYLHFCLGFYSLRVHRNSIGIHLSNLRKKDGATDDESFDELILDSATSVDDPARNIVKPPRDKSVIDLKQLFFKNLERLRYGPEKDIECSEKLSVGGRRVLVSFELHSIGIIQPLHSVSLPYLRG